jgi:CheY-like chemotaxis protein
MGFVVETAEGPTAALQMLANAGVPFDVMITDFSMPEMSGMELAAQASALRPDLRVILLTGFVEELREDELRKVGIRLVLHKPVLGTELADACAAVLRAEPDRR